MKLDTGSVFKKLNKGCYGADGIDYPRVVISYGSVAGAQITSAEICETGDAEDVMHNQLSNEGKVQAGNAKGSVL